MIGMWEHCFSDEKNKKWERYLTKVTKPKAPIFQIHGRTAFDGAVAKSIDSERA